MYKNNRNYNSYKFSYKFAFIPCLSFRRNQKQESNFQQVADLVMRNISIFCSLYFKAMPNSIDFYVRIFLFVIPFRIIVSLLYQMLKSFGKIFWSIYSSPKVFVSDDLVRYYQNLLYKQTICGGGQ